MTDGEYRVWRETFKILWPHFVDAVLVVALILGVMYLLGNY